MKAGLILLCLAVATHNAYQPLANMFADARRAEQEIFYIFQGASGLVMSLLILALAKPKHEGAALLLLGAAVYSAAEQALVVACGTAWLLKLGIADVDAAYLCERTTGWQVWLVPLTVVLAVLWRRREN